MTFQSKAVEVSQRWWQHSEGEEGSGQAVNRGFVSVAVAGLGDEGETPEIRGFWELISPPVDSPHCGCFDVAADVITNFLSLEDGTQK